MYIISTLSFILNPSTKDAGFHEKYSYQDNCQHSTVVKVKRYVHKAVARRTHKYLSQVLNRPYVKKSQNDGIAILDFRLIT